MPQSIRALIVEDSENDALLLVRELKKQGYEVKWERVQTAPDMRTALERQSWDVVLSDYKLPKLSAPAALRLLQDTGIDLPFIVISGAVGEDIAVETMKAGAHDYLMKGSLTRLGEAIHREMDATRIRAERRRVERALRESEERFRSICESTADAIATIDDQGRVVYWNPAAERSFGYTEEQVLGQTISHMMPERFRNLHQEALKQLARSERTYLAVKTADLAALRSDGVEFPVELSLSSWETDGRRYFTGIIRDVSARRRAQEQERLAKTVFETTNEAIVVTDADHRIVAVNPAFGRITGYTQKEVCGKKTRPHSLGKHDEEFYRSMNESIRNSDRWEGEIWKRRKNGEKFPGWMSLAAIRDDRGEIVQYVAVFRDITKRKQAQEVIRRQAFYDVVTGLPNRNLFLDRLDSALRRSNRDGSLIVLMFMDFDGFKDINDTFGHAAGDVLLSEMGRRLASCVRQTDTVARVGGDEFTVILTDVSHSRHAEILARKLLEVITKPVRLSGSEVQITASIGISLYPQDASDRDALLNNADAAMYCAKKTCHNGYFLFTSEMNRSARDR